MAQSRAQVTYSNVTELQGTQLGLLHRDDFSSLRLVGVSQYDYDPTANLVRIEFAADEAGSVDRLKTLVDMIRDTHGLFPDRERIYVPDRSERVVNTREDILALPEPERIVFAEKYEHPNNIEIPFSSWTLSGFATTSETTARDAFNTQEADLLVGTFTGDGIETAVAATNTLKHSFWLRALNTGQSVQLIHLNGQTELLNRTINIPITWTEYTFAIAAQVTTVKFVLDSSDTLIFYNRLIAT